MRSIKGNICGLIFLGIAALISAHCTPSPEAPNCADSLRVATLNIRFGEAPPWNTWAKSRPLVFDSVQELAPHVLAIQEGEYVPGADREGADPWEFKVQDILDRFPNYLIVPHDDSNELFSNGLYADRLLFDATRIGLIGHGVVQALDLDGNPIMCGIWPRWISWARFADIITQRPFYVFNVHFCSSQFESIKLNHAVATIQEMQNRDWPAQAAILVGDTNIGENSITMNYLTNTVGLLDAFRVINPIDSAAGTFNGFSQTNSTFGIFGARFDYILPESSFQIFASDVDHRFVTAQPGTTYPSDHYLVWADLGLVPICE